MKRILLLLAALILVSFAVQATTREKVVVPDSITTQPDKILPGDPILITVNSTSLSDAIFWDDREVLPFTYDKKTRALVPIDFNEKKLDHKIVVRLQNGETLTKDVQITPRPKIEKPLGIPEKLGGNTPQAAENLISNLARENQILTNVKTATTTLWSKPFAYPVTSVFITDDYGYSRQTVDQSITHKGTDFRAAIGTEVRAMNRGIVRLARSFTVYGNAVVIDHGLGVQTLYMHLSKLNVHDGDVIEKGTLIGLSGDSGYTEAAHLHISIKINGISIDPMTFINLFK